MPVLYIERAHFAVSLADLLRADLSASLRLESPKLTLQQPEAAQEPAKPRRARDLSAQLAELPPLRVSPVSPPAADAHPLIPST